MPTRSSASWKFTWDRFEGEDLEEALISRNLSDILENQPAIYRWRLSLKPPRKVIKNPLELQRWIINKSAKVLGFIEPKQQSHFLRTGTQWLGGGVLQTKKLRTLTRLLRDSRNSRSYAKWLSEFLMSIETSIPALYVGQTDTLRTRIGRHLVGDSSSNLLERLEKAGYSWQDLYMEALTLPSHFKGDAKKDVRELLEFLATRFSIAGLTFKAG